MRPGLNKLTRKMRNQEANKRSISPFDPVVETLPLRAVVV